MNRLGNLDNLSFGMGLGRAKPGQYIPAENANLDGFDVKDKVNNKLVIILVVIALFLLAKKRGVL